MTAAAVEQLPRVTYCSGAFADGSTWQPGSGTCATCGAPLTGRSRWFCKGSRSRGRSGGHCGRTWRQNHQWSEAKRAARKRAGGRCEHVDPRYGRCLQTRELEVDHIEPRRGGGYATGCWHHQDGLQVLCSAHHREKTRRDSKDAEDGRHSAA